MSVLQGLLCVFGLFMVDGYAIDDSPEPKMVDKLKGMLLLGAFGDSIGCMTEETCQSGNIWPTPQCKLLPFTPSPYHDSEWGVWPNQTQIEGIFGVITDDTSFRIALLQQWIFNSSSITDINITSFVDLNESNFKIYLNLTANKIWNYLLEMNDTDPETSSNPIPIRREEMMADFIIMMNDANEAPIIDISSSRGDNPFFIPSVPVMFGSYMYLELGGIIYNKYDIKNETQWKIISNISDLDQSYGHPYTGLLISLVSEALKHENSHNPHNEGYVHIWAYQQIMEWITYFDENNIETSWIEGDLQNLTTTYFGLGQKWRNVDKIDETEYLNRYKNEIYDNLPSREFINNDPNTFWMQIWLIFGYCESEIECIFRMLMAEPGDSDTVSSEIGTIIGAYYGYQHLIKLQCDDSNFEEQFDLLQQFLNQYYEYDVDRFAQLFYESASLFQM